MRGRPSLLREYEREEDAAYESGPEAVRRFRRGTLVGTLVGGVTAVVFGVLFLLLQVLVVFVICLFLAVFLFAASLWLVRAVRSAPPPRRGTAPPPEGFADWGQPKYGRDVEPDPNDPLESP